jgi:hypothetical protein
MPRAVNGYLTRIGIEALGGFAERRDALSEALEQLPGLGDDFIAKAAERLIRQLDKLEPSVTMIGQVKAGKTSLVNAICGLPDLLPADVNPWTSVVTSLHLSPAGFETSTRASFQFFGDDEWDRLVSRGGRIGEMARRAGAEDELQKVRAQLQAMREKSRQRLGRRFELLLSQRHDYDRFDRALIERYVCLGDDFDDSPTSRHQGRFADITRSADLFIERPDLPMALCIRDTPGVNDTFMMREQITIKAIRESRICVVVLSAHQALSNVDLALVRMIANVKSREVVIFVNRIDELSDPAAQIPEIRDSIRATLRAHQGPEDAELVFGSAYWANRALTGELTGMDKASTAALMNWAQAQVTQNVGRTPEEMIWELCGVPALMRALSARIVDSVGGEALDRTARSAQNLLTSFKAAHGADASDRVELRLPRHEVLGRMDRIAKDRRNRLEHAFETIEAEFQHRLERAHRSFLDRATQALIEHLERYGDDRVWQYDPAGLRLLLRSAFQVFASGAQRQVQDLYDSAAEAIAALYREVFAGVGEDFRVAPPPVPRVAPPVQIGQTIALDLKGNWWKRWWQRRRGFQSYAADFHAMIAAETRPIVDDLSQGVSRAMADDAMAVLREFLATQRGLLLAHADHAIGTSRPPAGVEAAQAARLDALLTTIDGFAEGSGR